jgi:hypothetical protein
MTRSARDPRGQDSEDPAQEMPAGEDSRGESDSDSQLRVIGERESEESHFHRPRHSIAGTVTSDSDSEPYFTESSLGQPESHWSE